MKSDNILKLWGDKIKEGSSKLGAEVNKLLKKTGEKKSSKDVGMQVGDAVALTLTTVGALNWGLVAIDEKYNLVSLVGDLVDKNATGPKSSRVLDRTVYGAVAASGVWTATRLPALVKGE